MYPACPRTRSSRHQQSWSSTTATTGNTGNFEVLLRSWHREARSNICSFVQWCTPCTAQALIATTIPCRVTAAVSWPDPFEYVRIVKKKNPLQRVVHVVWYSYHVTIRRGIAGLWLCWSHPVECSREKIVLFLMWKSRCGSNFGITCQNYSSLLCLRRWKGCPLRGRPVILLSLTHFDAMPEKSRNRFAWSVDRITEDMNFECVDQRANTQWNFPVWPFCTLFEIRNSRCQSSS